MGSLNEYRDRKRILVVVTNIAKYPQLKRATGLWLGEAVHFVKKLQDEGYQVDYISPQGGLYPHRSSQFRASYRT